MRKINEEQEDNIYNFMKECQDEMGKIEDSDIEERDIALSNLAQNVVGILGIGTIYSTTEENTGYPNVKRYVSATEKGNLTIEIEANRVAENTEDEEILIVENDTATLIDKDGERKINKIL